MKANLCPLNIGNYSVRCVLNQLHNFMKFYVFLCLCVFFECLCVVHFVNLVNKV